MVFSIELWACLLDAVAVAALDVEAASFERASSQSEACLLSCKNGDLRQAWWSRHDDGPSINAMRLAAGDAAATLRGDWPAARAAAQECRWGRPRPMSV